MLDLYTYALIADDCYLPGANKAGCHPLLKSWHREDYGFLNYFCSLYSSGIDRVLAFRGTDGPGSVAEDLVGVVGLAGLWHFNDAVERTRKFKDFYPNLVVAGHSLGGGYAQVAAAATSSTGVTFNAPGMFGSVPASANTLVHPIDSGRIWINRLTDSSQIYNFRNPADPVSLWSIHIGHNVRNLPMPLSPSPFRAHSMDTIVAWLAGQPRKKPEGYY